MPPSRNRVSVATARFIPVFLVAIVVYASYTVVGPLSIDYLINDPNDADIDRKQRLTAGLAIPIVYFVLLIPVAIAWLRLLVTVLRDPGYVPLGAEEKIERPSILQPQPGLEAFWMRDVFVCDPNGLPIWCDYCHTWKPDRAHHNQDVGRCTRKMDHFCPWVGGVVGERSFKFFIQFLFYTMILTGYLTGVFGFYVSKSKHNVHWFVVLGLAGFFCLFSAGMVMNSMNMVFKNTTTIEMIRGRMLPSRHESASPASKLYKGTITYPLHLPTDRPPIPAPVPRTFAILEAPRGLNPWNLGSAWLNFKAVFGSEPHEWVLPFRHSPCCDHTSQISEFPLGPEFEVLLSDAGLVRPPTPRRERRPSNTPSRRKKRRLDAGWQDGERPDGWVSEKEARRIRNEWRRRQKQSRDDQVP
ncbi:uncharacterized protein MYCFIDRAFT_152906 [Pseudocercospora fijiensis CIRAD86]|uniref:Palmitoyltransferase n=1 Tax=Pseudocercospora fijiensis (strain CIRAD86) TaxID=383855 RepID=M3B5R7_PSEFD|nr:uncharacterized protein MYCFIDRAFT_152906 [Pseudocercospora fijiensis CIRAD86]EME84688.1 hypothetical protein MYCFIDRAFT_152906 [Pseudocercospora fijiensis CIRAD86]